MMTDFDAARVQTAAETAFSCALLGEEGESDDAAAAEFGAALATIVEMGLCAVQAALVGWCGLTLGRAQVRGALQAYVPACTLPAAPAGSPGRLTVTERPQVADGFWSLEAGNTASTDQIGTPGLRDAMRLVTCLGNGDDDTIAAIVETAWKAGAAALGDLMFETVRLAASADLAGRIGQ